MVLGKNRIVSFTLETPELLSTRTPQHCLWNKLMYYREWFCSGSTLNCLLDQLHVSHINQMPSMTQIVHLFIEKNFALGSIGVTTIIRLA